MRNFFCRYLIFFVILNVSSILLSEDPYRYRLTINVLRKIENEINVNFILNTPSRSDWRMKYGEGKDNFLDIFLKPNTDGTYRNVFRIGINSLYNAVQLINVNHASKDFLKLDAISQLQHLFTEINFEINEKKYSLDLANLDKDALRLNYREIFQAHTVINFDITEEFLSKYCILQENQTPEKSE